MDLSAHQAPIWQGEDFGTILGYQLSTPLLDDLAYMPRVDAQGISDLAHNARPPIRTYRDVFNHPDPPLGLIHQVKSFSKFVHDHPDQLLPKPVASMMYYAALSAGLVKHHQRLTTLDDAALQKGIRWALDQPWIDPNLQPLFEQARGMELP